VVRRLAAEAADELRAIVVGLRPADLAGDGLDLALRKQAELLDRVHGARVRFTGDQVPRLTAAREEAAYRIAQEALHNALRHADARAVHVALASRNGTVVLEVGDDGKGFDPAGAGQSARRLGLASMRERARAVGGRLDITSGPGAGTTVRLEVPTGG
jgi:signal transduction histidine kinase